MVLQEIIIIIITILENKNPEKEKSYHIVQSFHLLNCLHFPVYTETKTLNPQAGILQFPTLDEDNELGKPNHNGGNSPTAHQFSPVVLKIDNNGDTIWKIQDETEKPFLGTIRNP